MAFGCGLGKKLRQIRGRLIRKVDQGSRGRAILLEKGNTTSEGLTNSRNTRAELYQLGGFSRPRHGLVGKRHGMRQSSMIITSASLSSDGLGRMRSK